MAGDTVSDFRSLRAYMNETFQSTFYTGSIPEQRRSLFFWEVLWRNHIGKTKNILTSVIKNANIFPAIRAQIRRILTVCSVTAPCTRWGIDAGGISAIQKRESRTVPTVSFLIRNRITAI